MKPRSSSVAVAEPPISYYPMGTLAKWRRRLMRLIPQAIKLGILDTCFRGDPETFLLSVARHVSPDRNLSRIGPPPRVEGDWGFEHLANLFASTALDHGAISMTIQQAAYIFQTLRTLKAKKVIEIGRYKGGSTVLLAAALGQGGEVWSIDNHAKEDAIRRQRPLTPFDQQIEWYCSLQRWNVHLLVGDSRDYPLEVGEVDAVLIDGGHDYQTARADLERWGLRLRVGGALFVDDAAQERWFPMPHTRQVFNAVTDFLQTHGAFTVEAGPIDRLLHLRRYESVEAVRQKTWRGTIHR